MGKPLRESLIEEADAHGPLVGNRLKNGAWCLASRKTANYDPADNVRYNYVVLTFHSGAGADFAFGVGRCDPYGDINLITYDGFATLPYALFNYTYERGGHVREAR